MMAKIQKNILVVDGDPFYCSMMVSALRQAGYRSSSCSENEVLSRIKRTVFDLVFIDMGMFSGYARQLVRTLRQKNTFIPIFTVADPSDKMFIIDLLRNGHRDIIENYIEKAPCNKAAM